MFASPCIIHDAPERVTEVRADPCDARPGAKVVITQRGGKRTTYLGVTGFHGAVGDELKDALRHRASSVIVAWSPWEGVDDD